MKWTISQLHQLQNKGLNIDEMVDVSDIKQVNEEIRDIKPVHVVGRADINASKATFHLKISGSMTLPCSRTLVDVNYPFSIETTETFLLKHMDFETFEDLHETEGEIVDLTPIIKEILLLEIPMQVFCDDVREGQEIAPQSGKDWEVITEDEHNNKIDPRLAELAKFFENNDKN
ncbi:DUF177 domain-containing protein [Metabacillus fastidiosus]|uniref:YceD family protein n=1 Tax=Metabacillus fastidiosus TaxID=1458 RepID=UPI002DB8150A|nr:DUF177 domain-containing protein [Metabacillus fastidiosus]MEC2074713.1 DUF177 domain-containing protein [Metabacillus fastidiosus]